MNAERPVFYKTKEGFIAPKSLLVKVVPLVTECVDLMGFLTDVNPETHEWAVLLFDSGTGSVVAASKECYAKYGIPPCLCDGHRSRPKNINVTQLFQNCSLTELTEKGASKGMKTADTSFIENMGIERELLPKGEEVNAENVYKRHSVKIETKAEENFGEVDFGLIELRIRGVLDTDLLNEMKISKNKINFSTLSLPLTHNFVISDNESEEGHSLQPKAEEVKMEKEHERDIAEYNDEQLRAEVKLAEDERKLKEKKSKMENSQLPLSLRILTPLFITAALVLIVLLVVNLGQQITLSNTKRKQFESVSVYKRKMTLITDLNSRILEVVSVAK